QLQALQAAHPDFQTSLVHVLTGNLHGRLGEWDAADAAYTRGLDADLQSPRPLLGRGEIEYQQGRGDDCAPDSLGNRELEHLDRSLEHFDAVDGLVGQDRPRVAMIASYGRARVARCRTFAGVADEEQAARRSYQQALSIQAEHPDVGVDVAAEAHAALANLDLRAALDADGATAVALFESSLDHADAAVRAGAASRASVSRFIQQRAIAAWHLGDGASACQDVEVAALQAQQGIQDELRLQQLEEIAALDTLLECG
ncbi:MAG TPA: hypothetical protein VJ978_05530, partial [Nitriliruptoraceae bacterium]|nr:hypothetical protein [Nitriliruptoraceae bacterium]